jgi:hypothetical protein
MPKFKVLVESGKTHVYRIEPEDPQEASKISLKCYLSTSEVNDVDEILVIDPENEWSLVCQYSRLINLNFLNFLGVNYG